MHRAEAKGIRADQAVSDLEERTIMSVVAGVVSDNNQGSYPTILGDVNGA